MKSYLPYLKCIKCESRSSLKWYPFSEVIQYKKVPFTRRVWVTTAKTDLPVCDKCFSQFIEFYKMKTKQSTKITNLCCISAFFYFLIFVLGAVLGVWILLGLLVMVIINIIVYIKSKAKIRESELDPNNFMRCTPYVNGTGGTIEIKTENSDSWIQYKLWIKEAIQGHEGIDSSPHNCTNCGSKLPEGYSTCFNCGFKNI